MSSLRTRRLVVAAVLALVGTLQAHPASAAVGRTIGEHSVSQTGESGYTIDLFAPPGAGGLAPELSLAYSHRTDGTVAGVGWSIAGLSVITRCTKTWAQNGVVQGVTLSATDRFCLDGNQLKLDSGTYGQSTADYRTEVETYSRIRQYGTAGNGPAYFVVERKDGLIYEYGNSVDSRVEALGSSTVRAWALTTIRDRSNNRIAFTYTEDTTYGSYRLASVSWTTNPTQGVTAAARVMTFSYETQPAGEVESEYLAAFSIRDVTRLTRIDVTYNGSLTRRYNVAYESALSSSSRSRVSSITECAGSTGTDCFAPTSFSYQNGSNAINASVATGRTSPYVTFLLDVNGDGRKDLVYSSTFTQGTGTWRVSLANGTAYDPEINTGISNAGHWGAFPIDYNADGRDDLMVKHSGTTWWVLQGTATGFAAPVNTGVTATTLGRAYDVNGDGLDDLVYSDTHSLRYRLRVWGGTFSATVQTLIGTTPDFVTWVDGDPSFYQRGRNPDFNGDGRDDVLIQISNDAQEYAVAILSGGGQVMVLDATPFHPAFVDMNHDGYTDIAASGFDSNGNQLVLYWLSTGANFSAGAVGTTLPGSQGIPVAIDWDGDGFEDVAIVGGNGNWFLSRSTGLGLSAAFDTGISAAGTTALAHSADVQGDGLPDIVYQKTTGATAFVTHAGVKPDLLSSATDGFGNTVSFAYVSTAQASGSCYAQDSALPAFPSLSYRYPMMVACSATASAGNGTTYQQTFSYYNAVANLQGRGFSGFERRYMIDNRNGIVHMETFRTDYPYTGLQSAYLARQSDWATKITETSTTFASLSFGTGEDVRNYPYISQKSVSDYGVGATFNGSLLRTRVTTNLVSATSGAQYDSTTVTTEASTGNGLNAGVQWTERLHHNALFNDTTNWCLGRASSTQHTRSHTTTGGSQQTRTMSAAWNGVFCRPTQQVLEPLSATRKVTIDYGYDGFGNLSSRTETGIGMVGRATAASWGTNGYRPVSVTRAQGSAVAMTTQMGWDYAVDQQSSETDPNGLVASWLYDAFGRLTRANRVDGTYTTYALWLCEGSNNYCWTGVAAGRYRVEENDYGAGGAFVTQRLRYFDMRDRGYGALDLNLSGAYYNAVYEFRDALGRVSQRYMPYVNVGASTGWRNYSYDLADRLTVDALYNGAGGFHSQTTIAYPGLRVVTTDAAGKTSTITTNALGFVSRSQDHDGYYQGFTYDAFDNPIGVVDSAGVTLQTGVYDIRGLRTSSTDADSGNWSYAYNALGEMTSHTDALSQATTYTYDDLGRIKQRVEPVAGGGSITSDWTYGNSAAARNIGRIWVAQVFGTGITPYYEASYYDSMGRVERVDFNDNSATHSYNYAYSASTGLLDSIEYPTSTSGYRHKVSYDYQNGVLWKVRDFANTVTYWQANTEDGRGNIVDESLGNGLRTTRSIDGPTGLPNFIRTGPGGGTSVQNLNYSWNSVGSLTSRNDANQSLTETFYYDNLHRLDYSQLNGSTNLDVSYAPNGNIAYRSDVGSYTYHATKIHAVTAAGGWSYGYDANGNVISKNGASITWFANNRPKSISNGAFSSSFEYGPNRNYWKQVATYSNGTETTRYIGGLLEIVQGPSVTSWRHHIKANGRTVAVYSRGSNGVNNTVYPLRDHLESVEAITNSSGAVIVRESFTAFGARRGSNWTGNPSSGEMTAIGDATRRGFTGHTMLDSIGLVHMNARVYDPAIGRFLSADPIIDGALSTQGWNRYSYVANDPLSAFDPSGFEIIKVTRFPGGSIITSAEGQTIFGRPHNELRLVSRPVKLPVGGAPQPPNVEKGPALTRETVWAYAKLALDVATDNIPVVNDVKAVYEAYKDPTPEKIGAAIVGVIPLVGDAAAKVIRNADKIEAVARAVQSVTSPAKRGPKPRGTGAHNERVRDIANEIESSGQGRVIAGGQRDDGLKEAVTPTPGGAKESRRADILYQTPSGEIRAVNVGRAKADGTPIKREQEALDDLQKKGGIPTRFEPYNK